MKALLNRIKNIVKFVYVLFCMTIKKTMWYAQYYRSKREHLYPQHLTKLELNFNEKIVILAPHADDEWIGPYAVLKQRLSKLHIVYFNLFGNNYCEENIRIRNAEIKASSEYWDFMLVNNYNYDVESLCEEIKDANKCFLPSPYDWHEEHRKVFQTFLAAYIRLTDQQRNNLEVYCYCISVPHPNHLPQYYIPLTKIDVDNKWSQFAKIYHSQSFMPALRYKLQLRLVPRNIGYAAQFFLRMEQDSLSCAAYFINDEADISKLISTKILINNIYLIRQYIDSLL